MAGYYDRDRNPVGSTSRTAAGTMNHAYAHHSSVSEYQASGVPFVYTTSIDPGSANRRTNGQALSGYEVLGDFTQKPDSGTPTNGSGTYYDKIVAVNLPFVSRWVMCRVYADGNVGTSLTDIKIGFGNYDADDGVQSSSYVTSYLTNGSRLELKCKKVYFVIPGAYAGTNGTSLGADLNIEVIAGLTGVSEFPDLDSTKIVGISSHDTNGSDSFTDVSTANSTNAS